MGRQYRLPDGKLVSDPNECADAWCDLGKALEDIFEGYTFVSCDPGLTIEKREINAETKTYRVLDRITLSVDGANALVARFQKLGGVLNLERQAK